MVTELALLHLRNGEGIDAASNSAVYFKLREGIAAQISYASYPAYLFSQAEDASYIYILGGWASVAAHVEDWIPSRANQEILGSLADAVEVVWLQHIDISPTASKIPIDAPVLAISRYFIPSSKKSGYEQAFSETKHHLEEYVAPRSLEGGWRLDCTDEKKDEFVLFSGWTTVEDHFKFAESDGFKEFGRIKEFLEGAEIKHAIRWDGFDSSVQ
jgi:heme-degrading monooxygenase HmoA